MKGRIEWFVCMILEVVPRISKMSSMMISLSMMIKDRIENEQANRLREKEVQVTLHQ